MSQTLPAPSPQTALAANLSAVGAPAVTPAMTRHERLPRLDRVSCLDYASGLLAAAGGRVCCVWNTLTHTLHCRIVVATPIDALWMQRDQRTITIAAGRRVSVHDLASGLVRFEYEHDAPITSVHSGSPATILASADVKGCIQLRDAADGRLIRTLTHPPGRPIVFVHRGQYVLVESHTHCTLVEIASGESVRRFPYAHDENVAFAGPRITTTLVSHTASVLRWFDCSRYEGAYLTKDLGAQIHSIDICDERDLVLAALADGRICFFDLNSGEARGVIDSFTQPLLFAKFGEHASVYAAAGEALVMHLVDGHHMRSYYDESPPLVAMALHADRQALLVSDRDGGVAHFSLRDGRRHDRFAGHSGSVSVVECCNEWIASGAYDGKLRVCNWDGRVLLDVDLQDGPVQAIALDPAARRVWAGTWTGRVSCFDVDTRETLLAIACGASSIRTLCLDARRERLLVGGDAGEISVLDLNSGGKPLQRMRQPGAVYRGVFAPDGDILTSADDGVRRFAARATAPHRLYPCSEVRWFALTQQKLFVLSLSGELKACDAHTGELLAHTQIDGRGPHRSVASFGSDRVFTASADGFVRVFDAQIAHIATLEVLRRGFLWRTTGDQRHSEWFFTDRDELIGVSDVGPHGSGAPWAATDPRRQRHLAVWNSPSHVMQVVTGAAPAVSALGSNLHALAAPARTAHRLGYSAGPAGATGCG